jgi:ferritin-like protein
MKDHVHDESKCVMTWNEAFGVFDYPCQRNPTVYEMYEDVVRENIKYRTALVTAHRILADALRLG